MEGRMREIEACRCFWILASRSWPAVICLGSCSYKIDPLATIDVVVYRRSHILPGANSKLVTANCTNQWFMR